MRRIARWMFYGVAGVCLVLLVELGWEWVRTYRGADRVEYDRAVGPMKDEASGDMELEGFHYHYSARQAVEAFGLMVGGGEIELGMSGDFGPVNGAKWKRDSGLPLAFLGLPMLGGLGFHAISVGQTEWVLDSNGNAVPSTMPTMPDGRPIGDMRVRAIGFPVWFGCLVLGVMPGLAGWRILRGRRVGPGCCRVCGYDLRASLGRCPECGAVGSKV